jgi:hypothetical protein
MLWTFGRGLDRIEIQREDTSDGPMLVVAGGDAPGSTLFPDIAALIRYQTQFEAALLDAGWSLIAFEPERRSHAERRAAKRDTFDRRRWWTDPAFRGRPND